MARLIFNRVAADILRFFAATGAVMLLFFARFRTRGPSPVSASRAASSLSSWLAI
jgi:uncharacterized protein (DUF1810 family)